MKFNGEKWKNGRKKKKERKSQLNSLKKFYYTPIPWHHFQVHNQFQLSTMAQYLFEPGILVENSMDLAYEIISWNLSLIHWLMLDIHYVRFPERVGLSEEKKTQKNLLLLLSNISISNQSK